MEGKKLRGQTLTTLLSFWLRCLQNRCSSKLRYPVLLAERFYDYGVAESNSSFASFPEVPVIDATQRATCRRLNGYGFRFPRRSNRSLRYLQYLCTEDYSISVVKLALS